MDGRRDWLSVRLAPADRHVWRGIAVDFEEPLDLSKAPYLGFACRPAVLPEGVDTLELAVVVTCGKNRQISTLTIEAGADTTVVVDLTSLPGRSACDGMAIYVRGANDTDPGEPTLLVGSVRVMSDRFEGKELEEAIRPHQVEEELPAVTLTTVITVAAIGLLALVAEGIRLRRRRQTKETDL